MPVLWVQILMAQIHYKIITSPNIYILHISPPLPCGLHINLMLSMKCDLRSFPVCLNISTKDVCRVALQGRPQIFDLNTYFHVLAMSEGAPVNRDKACFAACLQVINTLLHEAGIQAAEMI